MCPFRSTTGEIHEIVVTLSANEVADVMRHRREGRGAGEPGGPLEKRYAWDHALRAAPSSEFVPLFDQAQRVQ
jgi:hypothetical protein